MEGLLNCIKFVVQRMVRAGQQGRYAVQFSLNKAHNFSFLTFFAFFFFAFFPTFMSSCGFGFMRTSAPIRRLVSLRSDELAMARIPQRIQQTRDFKLIACLQYSHRNWSLYREPKTNEITAVARFFAGRCARLRGLMQLPATVGELTIRMQRAYDMAELELTGKLSSDEDAPHQFKQQIADRWQELLLAEAQRSENLRQTENWDANVLNSLIAGLKPTEIMQADVAASGPLHSSLMSYITTTWTIIETMTGDLWEAALNAHPGTLAHLNGKSNRMKSSHGGRSESNKSKEDEKTKTKDSKLIALDSIALLGFDTRNKMGSLLRSRFEFSRLDNIRQAYASAFDRDFTSIDHALTNQSLDALNSVRNLIIHKDAHVDDEYFKKSKFLKTMPKGSIGDHIVFDGEVVVELIRPAITSANQLLKAVDEWLVKHRSD
jgi:hypothetical protein